MVSPWNVCQFMKPGSCRLGLQPRVRGEGPGPPGLHTRSPALHHHAGGLVMQIMLWSSLGGPICR